MPLPYRFLGGEIAKSSEVNANFDYVMNTIGQLSGPSGIVMLGQFQFGPRGTGLLTAAQDTASAENSHLQLAWNVDWAEVNGVWQFRRRINGGRGASLRLGHDGLEFFHTHEQFADMNSTMQKFFRVGFQTYEKIFYLAPDLHFQNNDGNAVNVESYRLMTVFLDAPIAIYNGGRVGKGTTIFNALNLGVPSSAKGLLVQMTVYASRQSDANIYLYQQRPNQDNLRAVRGLTAIAPRGSGTSVQGLVPLGTDAVWGNFVSERTAEFSNAYVYIIGYLT